jgi:hypothetical protein
MNLRARRFTLFILALFFLAKLDAGVLTWDGKGRINVEIIEGRQKKVKVGFPFKNDSDHPVTITSVKTDCECVTAGLSAKTCPVGRKAMVIVTFDVAGLTGLQEQYITVTTDEPNQPPARLLLRVNIIRKTS